MKKVRFLLVNEVILINKDQIKRFGGLFGIRDSNLLESSIFAPQTTFNKKFLYKDLFEMAAVYLYSIIKNHPFIDGNKRTGMICGLLFLHYNNLKINISQDELFILAIKIAKDNLSIVQITKTLKSY